MSWKQHFQSCVEAFNFEPWHFEGEDKNLLALASKSAFIDWFGQDPGAIGEPYRDEGFYVREFTELSCFIQPKVIVELGTSLGLGALLLHILNPTAKLTTIDIRATQFLPGDTKVPTGVLAKYQLIDIEYVLGSSSDIQRKDVDFCFIDAEHSYTAVIADSINAWYNRNKERGVIVWHDYNDRHPGVVLAVNEFAEAHKLPLTVLPDSSTVYVMWGDE